MKISRQQIKQLINEEIHRQQEIKTITENKKILESCISKLEKGETLTKQEELMLEGLGSWLKGAGNLVGQKVGQATAGVGQALAQKTNQAVDATSQALKTGVKQASQVVKTHYANVEKGIADVSTAINNAGTAQEVKGITADVKKLFAKTQDLVRQLNAKEQQLGLPLTKYQSLAMQSVGQYRKA